MRGSVSLQADVGGASCPGAGPGLWQSYLLRLPWALRRGQFLADARWHAYRGALRRLTGIHVVLEVATSYRFQGSRTCSATTVLDEHAKCFLAAHLMMQEPHTDLQPGPELQLPITARGKEVVQCTPGSTAATAARQYSRQVLQACAAPSALWTCMHQWCFTLAVLHILLFCGASQHLVLLRPASRGCAGAQHAWLAASTSAPASPRPH